MVQVGYDYSLDLNEQPVYQPRKAEKISSKFNPRKKLLIKTGIALFAYALLMVFLSMQSAVLGYKVVELNNEINSLETTNKWMEYEIAEKTSLKRIEQVAMDELGMHKTNDYIVIAGTGPQSETVSLKTNTSDKEEAAVDIKEGDEPLKKIYASLLILVQKNHR